METLKYIATIWFATPTNPKEVKTVNGTYTTDYPIEGLVGQIEMKFTASNPKVTKYEVMTIEACDMNGNNMRTIYSNTARHKWTS